MSQNICKEYSMPDWFRSVEKADVSIIIPLYKSQLVIDDLVKSFPLNEKIKVEIIFIDDHCPNNSSNYVLESWIKRRHEIKKPVGRLLYNTTNLGYGQACNAASRFATGDYLIFLNADTVVTEGWIEPIIDLFQDKSVGIVGNMHLKKDGPYHGKIDSAGSEWMWEHMSFVHIGRHSHHKKNIEYYSYDLNNAPKDLLEVGEREMVTGCCFAISKHLFDYIGGFNANYKLGYWEDAEICMNVRELGYKILFQPKSIIYHVSGHAGFCWHPHMQSNINYFMNKWVKSYRLDKLLLSEARDQSLKPIRSIVVKRTSANGDALVATAVCKGLKKSYPDARISFVSKHPEVAYKNPHIHSLININTLNGMAYDLFYDLDSVYEARPNINLLNAYAEAVGVKKEDCEVYVYSERKLGLYLPDNYIVMHAGTTDWVGRDWPNENFAKLAKKLISKGENIVCVGKYTEKAIPNAKNLIGNLTVAQMSWVISKAKFFIGIDSLPMHVAQSHSIPGLAFFGSVRPETRIYDKNMHFITAKDVSCLGCHHDVYDPKASTHNCRTGTLDCINKLSVEEMYDKVISLLRPIYLKNKIALNAKHGVNFI